MTATDAAGNATNQAVALTVTDVDEIAPVFTSAATASVAENTAIATTVYDANATDNGGAADAGIAYSLSGADAALFNINAATGAVSFKASPNFEAPLDAGGNNVYDFTVAATDAAGNASSRSVALMVTDVDDTAPVFTSATTATMAENGVISAVAYQAVATDNVAVTAYSLSGADAALFNINATTGAVSFIYTFGSGVKPDFETPLDAGGNNVYDFSVTASDAAGNAANQAVALTVTDVDEIAPVFTFPNSISLGTYGNLIAPVQVEGKWYYFWDRSGDGTSADTGSLNGGVDYTTHDVLDALFTQDINGNTNPGADTTDTYRYATINGVRLALPTANGGMAYPNGIGNYQPGTTVADGASNNATYDELLAIWDAHNGAGTGLYENGWPAGWQVYGYWSATPEGAEHVEVFFNSGGATDVNTGLDLPVALEVLIDTLDPSTITAAASVAENTAIATVAYQATATDNVAVTAYSLSGTDAALFNINATTGAVTFKASPNFEAPADAGANNVYDFTVTATDAAGNAANQAVALTVTNVGPVFTSATTGNAPENMPITTVVYDANATDNGGAADAGITYTLSGGADAALFNIDATTGVVTFIAAPDYHVAADAGGDKIYDITVTATDAAGEATHQAVALSASINLGSYGNLIAPVQVEGKWYYFWDRSGDGTGANTGSLNGGRDYTDHDVLDALFTQDINGNTNPGADTTDTYRFATLNGVRLALPTMNGGMAYPNGIYDWQPGTTVADGATTNATYDELLAIWDAHNGAGTGLYDNGTPAGWQADGYWSATPWASGHAGVYLGVGDVVDGLDTSYGYVALEVL